MIGRPTLTHKEIDEICNRLHGIRQRADLSDIVVDPNVQMQRVMLFLVYDFFRDIPDHSFGQTLSKRDTHKISCSDEVYNAFIVPEADASDTGGEFDITDYININSALNVE